MKNFALFSAGLMLACAVVSCGSYSLDDKGVTIRIQNPGQDAPRIVRLEPAGEGIIHVSASAQRRMPQTKSLVVLPQDAVPFDVSRSGDTLTLSTSAVCASVLLSTGELSFSSPDGQMLLREPSGGGKTFTPVSADGKSAWSFTQVFESPEDEAFYGLGQHQSDEFNYKGKNEQLYQYNTKVSVPFLLSNKGYGILMDSYSQMRFGNPEDYRQLPQVFTLRDKNSVEGGLTGTWTPAQGEPLVRTEPQLYFEFLVAPGLDRVVNMPEGFDCNGAKVRFEGSVEAPASGTYQFILYYAGYTSVSIGGKTVVPERWRTAWNPNSYKFSVELEAGVPTDICVEWEPDGFVSYCGLRAYDVVDPQRQNRQTWWSEMSDRMDWYFIAGNDMDGIISGYRKLTGKAPIMPKWAMGYWQSRERYKTSTEMLDALSGFRERNIPIDNIVLDWSHWEEDAWGSHEFDLARFPDPKAMVDSIHSLGGRMMISVWPKFYVTTDHYKEFDRKGWMYTRALQDSVRDWIGPGYLYGFYDAYSKDARRLFWQQIYEHYYPLGIDAWWMDASEPNIRDCTDMEYRKALCGPTALGPSSQYFNAYALMNADAIYNGQRSADPDRRVFLLTRSGFAGLQRYSTATWSGDIATRWEDMKAQISAGLNFCISGIPYWTMDIGGFCVENRYVEAQQLFDSGAGENSDLKEWRELNARWFQFGAFCPLFRAHGQFPYREPWEIAPEGHPAYESILYYIRLRYALLPYVYSLAGRTWLEDYTIMRPLVMDFASDASVLDVSDQFLFGPSLMACPVYEYGARSRKVVFPQCEGWYDFYSNSFITGGCTLEQPAPYERMPLYVRAGSVIPVGEVMNYTDEKPAEYIKLLVYAGADGSFTLYEDDSITYAYEKGEYSTIRFDYDDRARLLRIAERHGSYPGMLDQRTFSVYLITPDGVISAGDIVYNGSEVNVQL